MPWKWFTDSGSAHLYLKDFTAVFATVSQSINQKQTTVLTAGQKWINEVRNLENNQIYYNGIKKEFIDRIPIIQKLSIDAHLKSFMELMQDDAIIEELKKAPVADVTPIVHAKWIYQDDEHVCSHCKGTILYELDNQGDAISEDWPWCARCGAKMDGRN